MATPPLKMAERGNLDSESRAMIYDGVSVNQLAVIFGIRANDVAERLGGVRSVGVGRQGNPLYRIADAAARLVKIPVTEEMIIQYMEKLNPKNLPPLLNKLFWDSMIQRRKYGELVGEMWLTSDVIKVASETFQSLRMSLLLIPDALVSETELTERQTKIVQEVIDTALDDMRERLVERLNKPSGGASVAEADDEPL
jgi:Protein of unknown function (DUF1441)